MSITAAFLIMLFGLILIIYGPRFSGVIGSVDWMEKYFGSTALGIQLIGLGIIILTVLVGTGLIAPLFSVFNPVS